MKTLINYVQSLATQTIQACFEKDVGKDFEAEVALSKQPKFGHCQINSCLKLGKMLGKNPRDLALTVQQKLKEDAAFDQVDVAGPGFINIHFNHNFIAKRCQSLLRDERLGVVNNEKKQKVIVEFSSPNVAKELHVGHLRSTIIGESLARFFEFQGLDVLRLNHIGDWGTQFGMLIGYLKEYQPNVFLGTKEASIDDLMGWYKAAKKHFDENPSFKKRAQAEVVALQSGHEESLVAWEKICEISRVSYENIYQLLDVKIEERGESFYNPFLKSVVDEFVSRGLVEESEGAKCVFMPGFVTQDKTPLPLMIQKSDGGYNYATTDLAALKHRIESENASRIVYVTDLGQKLHFEMVFKAMETAKLYDPAKVRIDHVGFGVVLGEDGKKFKTRSGETVKLIDLLLEAIRRAKALLHERMPDEKSDWIDHASKVLGINAVKYADLSTHRQKDYRFSYERMLRFEGNTASFLMYSYVRAKSIRRKSGKVDTLSDAPIDLTHASEMHLAVKLLQFTEVFEEILDTLLPSRLCEYLYELAEDFNAFFRDCRVIGDNLEDSRLQLCDLTAKVLHTGLSLLGLHLLEKM